MEDKSYIHKAHGIKLTPKQVKELETETGVTNTCVPAIIGTTVVVDDDGEADELFELNCDCCMEVDCIYFEDSHSKEETEAIKQLIEEMKVNMESEVE